MALYDVHMARTTWLTMHVEADDEDQALEEAYQEAPTFTAHEGGWGSFGKWDADAGEWEPIDEFHNWAEKGYDPKAHGPVVEEVEKHRGSRW